MRIYIGTIREIFGYGLSVVGHSEKECYYSLFNAYCDWSDKITDDLTDEQMENHFNDAFDYWGGVIKEVKPSKVYYDNFCE
jgi:hypothetical protein